MKFLKDLTGEYWYYQTVGVMGSMASLVLFMPNHGLLAVIGIGLSIAYATTKASAN